MNASDNEREGEQKTPSTPAPRIPLWLLALSTTLWIQTVSTFLFHSPPIIAPLLTAQAGIAPERIGNIYSLTALGVILLLLFGGPILARLGPVRMLQIGVLLMVCGVALVSSGWWPLLVLGPIIMGLGYGPSPPAGNRILAETAPARHRSLIFSIKQSGAPLGGALTGLILAPAAAAWGLPAALMIAIAAGVGAAAIVTPTARRLNFEREPDRPIGPAALFNPRNVAAPEAVQVGDAWPVAAGCCWKAGAQLVARADSRLAEAGISRD
jgi:MFS family permease